MAFRVECGLSSTFWVLLGIICISAEALADQPYPSNDDMTTLDNINRCVPYGKVSISIKNRNGTFTVAERIPWDLFCFFDPDQCTMRDGKLELLVDELKNKKLTGKGMYGVKSRTAPVFARLVVFETRANHSDPDEQSVRHGCHGTMHQDLIPKNEPWFALIQRGDCYFTQKLENAVDVHGASGFIMYNSEDSDDLAVMNLTTPGLSTIMVNFTFGYNIDSLDYALNLYAAHDPNATLPYTNEIYANISYSHCEERSAKKKPPVAVTVVAITFVVVMIVAIAWLVIYYFQKHRNANKHIIQQVKLQKASRKALKKIGERVIHETDEEAVPENQQDCTYCLEPLLVGEVIRQLPCRHKFHKDCVDDWLVHNRTCPNCHDNILVATGITIRGLKQKDSEDDMEMTEMTDIGQESQQQLLSDSQPVAGHEEETDSQCWGSQMIPGSQLLTDGQNMFLYVPDNVKLPTDTTIQISNPPTHLQQLQPQSAAQPAAQQSRSNDEQKQQLLEHEQAT